MSASRTKEHRPFLVVANSSWYLMHYRQLLLETLQCRGDHVVALSPVDSATPELSRLLVHIPWRILRSTDANPFSLVISFLRMLFLVRAIKPRLVHSHTLKANLLAVIVTSFFGVPCVLSFAGLGRLSKARGFSRMAFLLVLKIIAFFSAYQRCSRWCWKSAPLRTALIFQNSIDQTLFQSALPNVSYKQIHLIPGSGVPIRFFGPGLCQPVNQWCSDPISPPVCDLLYCGRLLRSKGIGTFLELASQLDTHRFTAFGGIDPSSKDSLSSLDLSRLRQEHTNVFFADSQDDPLLNLHVDFPVLLVPSNYGEGLPRAVVEALALRIPVITSRSASCGIFSSDIVYISDGDSSADYEDCLDHLLADYSSGVLHSRIQSGYQFVEQQLSERVVVQKTMALYESLQAEHAESYLLDKDDDRLRHWLAQ